MLCMLPIVANLAADENVLSFVLVLGRALIYYDKITVS